jgi:hypothetical protein
MGLFDTVIIERSLIEGSDSRADRYLAILGDKKVALQTKDFDCALSTYLVEDGKLYFEKVDREWIDEGGIFGGYMEEKSREKVSHFATHTIRAYDLVHSEPFDIWIEFEIVFIEGVVKSITIKEYRETDSKPRIERDQQWLKELKEFHEFRQTLRGKIQLSCQAFIKKVLRFCSKQIRKVSNFLDRLAFKL